MIDKTKKHISAILMLFEIMLMAVILTGCKGASSNKPNDVADLVSTDNDPIIGVVLEDTGEKVYDEEEYRIALLSIQGSADTGAYEDYAPQIENTYQPVTDPLNSAPLYLENLSDDYTTPADVVIASEPPAEPVVRNDYPAVSSTVVDQYPNEPIVADTIIQLPDSPAPVSGPVVADIGDNHLNPDKVYNFDTYRNYDNQNTSDTYVLNTSSTSMKIHHPDCADVVKIKHENYATSNLSIAELIAQGYSTCGHCFK